MLAGVALLSSLIILYICLNSWSEDGLLYQMGSGKLSYGQVLSILLSYMILLEAVSHLSSGDDGDVFEGLHLRFPDSVLCSNQRQLLLGFDALANLIGSRGSLLDSVYHFGMHLAGISGTLSRFICLS